jgi:MoaA/NifB/PqqE/SkfB family radical SAM enzyme
MWSIDNGRSRRRGVAARLRQAWVRWEIRHRRKRLVSMPETVNIELTGKCNVKPACTFCVGKNLPLYHEPGHLDLKPYWPLLLRARRVNDCSYGEPMLYPGFDGVVARLAAAGVKFGFTTNGLLLTERRARFLAEHGDAIDFCVSVNAASAAIYAIHHGQDFGRLVANLRRFVQIHSEVRPGQPLPMVLSFIVMRSNRHEIADFLRLAHDIGLKRVLLRHLFDLGYDGFTANSFGYHFRYGTEMLPLEDYQAIERAVRQGRPPLDVEFAWNPKDSFIAEQAEEGVDIPCLFPWKFLCVRPLHDIYAPCVYHKQPMASPAKMSIAEVWNGEVMRGLRRALAAGKVPDYCMERAHNCPLVMAERAKHAPAMEPSPRTVKPEPYAQAT